MLTRLEDEAMETWVGKRRNHIPPFNVLKDHGAMPFHKVTKPTRNNIPATKPKMYARVHWLILGLLALVPPS
jgi:hypothetical protein